MKKYWSLFLFSIFSINVFAQQLPTVAVATFDVMGGITEDETKVVTELFMTELVSKGTVSVVDRENFDKIIAEMRFQTSDWSDSQKTAQLGKAINAQYVIRGQLMKMGSTIYWTATMIDVKTAQVLSSAKDQIKDLGEIWGKLSGFCLQMLDKIPVPNYFIGKWRGIVYSFTCIMEFKADGNIVVTQYDTQIEKEMKKSGKGTGYYSLNGNKVRINITLSGVNDYFKGIDMISDYTFDDSKNGFTLSQGLWFWDGANSNDFYKSFVKIQ